MNRVPALAVRFVSATFALAIVSGVLIAQTPAAKPAPAEDNPFAPPAATPLPAGMTGSRTDDPRVGLKP